MRRIAIESEAGPDPAVALRPCDHPGCAGAGDFRAPRSRADLNTFYWFCLDHIRAYNSAWNYYAGMSEAEIEAEIRHDTVWQRPTWPLGSRIGARYRPRWNHHGLFDEDDTTERTREAPRQRALTPHEEALSVFELAPPITLPGLKARYKELVKRHHPDTNGGDKAAEEKLKVINQAYATLKANYFPGS